MTTFYLAGKISRDGWRKQLVPAIDELSDVVHSRYDQRYLPNQWPIAKRALLGCYDYAGPYFLGERHGLTHGPNQHGVGLEYNIPGVEGMFTSKQSIERQQNATVWMEIDRHRKDARDRLVSLCLQSIRCANIVFAWIDSLDAYGTLVELGYAAALGKPILLGFAEELDWDPPEE